MIVYPVSWILILVGVVRFRSIRTEMEQQEKEWMYSGNWQSLAELDLRSTSYRFYGTPLYNGLFVFFLSLWVLSGFLVVGEVASGGHPGKPPIAYTGFKFAPVTAFFSLGFVSFGFESRAFQTLAAWRRRTGKN